MEGHGRIFITDIIWKDGYNGCKMGEGRRERQKDIGGGKLKDIKGRTWKKRRTGQTRAGRDGTGNDECACNAHEPRTYCP